MISLNFTNSLTHERLGLLTYFKDALFISKGLKSDIILREPTSDQFHIFMANNKIFIKSLSGHFFCNSKKYQGKKEIKVGDIIRIQSDQFSITDFKESTKTNEDSLKEGLKKFRKETPQYIFLIEHIQKELLAIEQKKDV